VFAKGDLMGIAHDGRARGTWGSGRLLQLTAAGHAAVGIQLYRRELRSLARDGVLAAVPYRGPQATAFWFLMSAPTWWLTGRLLSACEEAHDESAQRAARRVALAIAAVGVTCTPVSGFWGLLLIALRSWHLEQRSHS
jgi:hypothetical protein